jgi:AcrR family transcriptional regulator
LDSKNQPAGQEEEMSRPPMVEDEIIEVKEKILDTAALITLEEGFFGLSMRKIGKKIGMTGANLYNYYSNKDEINIAIRLRAGRLLFHSLEAAYESGPTVSEKLWLMIKAFVNFGLNQSPYYEVLIGLPTPKYTDYIGTPLEPLAKTELDSGLRSRDLVMKLINDFLEENYTIPGNPKDFFIALLSQAHGLLSLYHNGLLKLMDDEPEETVVAVTKLLYEIVCQLLDIDPVRTGNLQ